MASEIAKRIDEVIKLGIAPMLKQHGFRKRGRNFHRLVGEMYQAVNIQSTRLNSGSRGRFTVNLGVYCERVNAIADPSMVKQPPTEVICTVRARIGTLMPRQDDKWWTVSPQTDMRALAGRVAKHVEEYGLPWMDAASSLKGLRAASNFLNANALKFGVALEFVRGDMTEARRLLKDGLASASDPEYRNWITQWGRDLKLI